MTITNSRKHEALGEQIPIIVKGLRITVGNQTLQMRTLTAIPVHEDVGVEHPVGEAKFLQTAVDDAASQAARRMAARMILDKL